MDNPEKMATLGTQDDAKQNKNTTQYVLDTPCTQYTLITCTQIHTNNMY